MTIFIQVKICRRCELPKALNNFHIRRNRNKGLQSYCIECEKLNNQENYKKRTARIPPRRP